MGKSVADLEDKRDLLVKDISQYIDIQTFVRESGALNIATNSGITLLSESRYKLSYNAQPSAASFIANNTLLPIEVTRLNDAGNPTGLPVKLVTGGTSAQVASTVSNGQIKGPPVRRRSR